MNDDEKRRKRHQIDLDYLLNNRTDVDMSPEAITERLNKLNELWELMVALDRFDLEGAQFIHAMPVDVR